MDYDTTWILKMIVLLVSFLTLTGIVNPWVLPQISTEDSIENISDSDIETTYTSVNQYHDTEDDTYSLTVKVEYLHDNSYIQTVHEDIGLTEGLSNSKTIYQGSPVARGGTSSYIGNSQVNYNKDAYIVSSGIYTDSSGVPGHAEAKEIGDKVIIENLERGEVVKVIVKDKDESTVDIEKYKIK
jgi:hypothetical protein